VTKSENPANVLEYKPIKMFWFLLNAEVYIDNSGAQNLKQLERKIRACVQTMFYLFYINCIHTFSNKNFYKCTKTVKILKIFFYWLFSTQNTIITLLIWHSTITTLLIWHSKTQIKSFAEHFWKYLKVQKWMCRAEIKLKNDCFHFIVWTWNFFFHFLQEYILLQ